MDLQIHALLRSLRLCVTLKDAKDSCAVGEAEARNGNRGNGCGMQRLTPAQKSGLAFWRRVLTAFLSHPCLRSEAVRERNPSQQSSSVSEATADALLQRLPLRLLALSAFLVPRHSPILLGCLCETALAQLPLRATFDEEGPLAALNLTTRILQQSALLVLEVRRLAKQGLAAPLRVYAASEESFARFKTATRLNSAFSFQLPLRFPAPEGEGEESAPRACSQTLSSLQRADVSLRCPFPV